MTKRTLFLGAAVMALMIGGTSPAGAQYYRDYKPNDKPAVEVDMGVLDGTAAPQAAPGYVAPVAREPLPVAAPEPAPAPVAAPIVSLPPVAAPVAASTRVLKPSAPASAAEEMTAQEEMPAPEPVRSYPPTQTGKAYSPTAKPYRPYLTTPVAAKPAPVPEPVAAPVPEVAAVQEEVPSAPVEAPAPLPTPVHKPVVAKQYQPSPSVVDDASYKPDYSGYYKSGDAVPAAIANVAPKPTPKPLPKPVMAEAPVKAEPAQQEPAKNEFVAAAPAPVEAMPEPQSKPQLDPMPAIATETSTSSSIEQTPAPVEPMMPIVSAPEQKSKMVAMATRQAKVTSMPVTKVEYAPKPEPESRPMTESEYKVASAPVSSSKIVSMPEPAHAPAYQPNAAAEQVRTPAKIISYPDSTVVTRPTGQFIAPAPVMTPEPAPVEKVVSMPAPQHKPAPIAEPMPEPAPQVVTEEKHRPSLEILSTPAPERPASVEPTESIIPPVRTEEKTDIAKLAAQVDNAAAEMGTAPAPVEPEKFAAVPTHSDLTLEFPGNSSDLTAITQRKLDSIVRQMEDLVDGGRLQVRGYAAGEDGSKSSARRIALSRALSVRSYLMDKGVKAKRVDVRAMGSETDRNPLDRVDLIFQK